MSRRTTGRLSRRRESACPPGFTADSGVQPPPPEVQTHNRWLTFAVCLFLALAVWAVFGQTLHHEFVNYDDDVYVYENPAITQGLSLHGVVWTFTHDNGLGQWLPLTALSHMLDCQLYGPNRGRASSDQRPAPCRDCHPAVPGAAEDDRGAVAERLRGGGVCHSSVAGGIGGVGDGTQGCVERVVFHADPVGVCRAMPRSREPGARSGELEAGVLFRFLVLPAYWLALLLFTLGLLSKTMLVTLPFVLLLLDYWPLEPAVVRWTSAPRSRLHAWTWFAFWKSFPSCC